MNVKKSAYSKRNEMSIPAPMEPDSDPDFNPGRIPSDEEKNRLKKRGARKRREAINKRGHKRKRQDHEPVDSDYESDLNIARASNIQSTVYPNLLELYLGKVVDQGFNVNDQLFSGLSNDFGDEDDADNEMDEEEEQEQEAEEDMNSDEDEMSADDSRRVGMTASKPLPQKLNSKDHEKEIKKNPRTVDGPGEESVTESDSDGPIIVSKSISKPDPEKPLQNDEESLTESETDSEAEIWTSKKPSNVIANEDSETESDSEDEGFPFVGNCQNLKPGFPLSPGQTRLGPLFLDAEKKYKVPASINTYLREYQRDGVKFFYEHYKEGMGGLLGDDMGLGKSIHRGRVRNSS
ncbi:hypothetical protein K435DRAFT_861149 [Dendrothele bispora CBS 962.96]|uniref:SNF2 N-terminal domain-containing protein n=1 Tax=Dendrothele bispora (strain CBS 962.96) TaxID=1314807 RepID=A0A4S8LW25_DENBC|nr:hypothetical protein K435DRAFT_861149 [Dendrothele bispora CBS 962.96]